MQDRSGQVLRSVCFMTAALGAAARADVTIEQKMTLDVASVIRTHGSSTTNFTADKKREDTESHCEGMLSLVCGNVRGGEIVRLDRGLTWHLEPDKKSYREDVFATPEELAQMRARMQARLEKMRSCPVASAKQQPPIDKSKCEMSPPKIEVRKTDDKSSILGHDAQRTVATLTETCTNKDTGDVCDTVVAIDVWLTQDKLPGVADRHAFDQAYAKKLGLTDERGALSGEFAKFLAPYQSQIKQLTDKSSDLKGQPLKTSLRVMMGGQQCSATAKMKSNGAASAANPAGGTPNPMANVAQAGKAIGSALGGLFHKKKADDASPAAGAATPDAAAGASAPPAASAPTTASAPAAASTPAAASAPTGASAPPGAAGTPAAASDPYAQFVQMAAFTTETVAINTDTVPAGRFDVPADWKKDVPKAAKVGDDDFTCPKTGN